jgi:hypothetical protein
VWAALHVPLAQSAPLTHPVPAAQSPVVPPAMPPTLLVLPSSHCSPAAAFSCPSPQMRDARTGPDETRFDAPAMRGRAPVIRSRVA